MHLLFILLLIISLLYTKRYFWFCFIQRLYPLTSPNPRIFRRQTESPFYRQMYVVLLLFGIWWEFFFIIAVFKNVSKYGMGKFQIYFIEFDFFIDYEWWGKQSKTELPLPILVVLLLFPLTIGWWWALCRRSWIAMLYTWMQHSIYSIYSNK